MWSYWNEAGIQNNSQKFWSAFGMWGGGKGRERKGEKKKKCIVLGKLMETGNEAEYLEKHTQQCVTEIIVLLWNSDFWKGSAHECTWDFSVLHNVALH